MIFDEFLFGVSRPSFRPRTSAARRSPARPANRDSHELAVDTGTLQESPAQPATGSRSRAATAVTFNPAARSASAAKITAAAYLRRDSRKPGSSTCDRPQPPRQIPRHGRTTAGLDVITSHIRTHQGALGRLPGEQRAMLEEASATVRRVRRAVPVAFGPTRKRDQQ